MLVKDDVMVPVLCETDWKIFSSYPLHYLKPFINGGHKCVFEAALHQELQVTDDAYSPVICPRLAC